MTCATPQSDSPRAQGDVCEVVSLAEIRQYKYIYLVFARVFCSAGVNFGWKSTGPIWKCSAECGRDTKCLQVAAAYSTRHSMFFRRVVAYSDRTYWPFQYFDRCFACMGSSALLFRLKWGGRAAWHPVPRSPATRPQRLVRWLAHAFSCVLVRSRFLNSSNS